MTTRRPEGWMRPADCQKQIRLIEKGRNQERRFYRLSLTGVTTALVTIVARLTLH